MCTYNSITVDASKLSDRYKRQSEVYHPTYRANAYAHPEFPIILSDSIKTFHWGLIPSWIHNVDYAKELADDTINVKAENIFDKPELIKIIDSKRCIIPSTGFFEWRNSGSFKQPYYVKVKKQEIFSIAGIYQSWENPTTGKTENTFSMLTLEGNDMIKYIGTASNRIPFILSPEKEEEWLKPKLTKYQILALMDPISSSKLEAYAVSLSLLNLSPFDHEAIKPIGRIIDGSKLKH